MIKWENLKEHDNSKNLTFEMFCYAIARRKEGNMGKFIMNDGSGGDGGVEFYIEFENGDIWGWQCKFFFPDERLSYNGNHTRKEQIKKSLRATCKNYKNVTKWFLCTTTDFTPSENDWFHEKLYKEVPEDHELELIHWGKSEFSVWLSDPNFEGIKNSFFGELELSFDWFKNQFENNYVPNIEFEEELYIESNVAKNIKKSLIDQDFIKKINQNSDKIQNTLSEFEKYNNELESFEFKEKNDFDDLKKYTDNFLIYVSENLNAINSLIEILKNNQYNNTESINFSILNDLAGPIDKYYELIENLIHNNESYRETDEFEKYNLTMQKHKKLLLAIVNSIKSTIKSLKYTKFSDLHIFGDAGSGKTYLVTNLCDLRLKNNQPAVLISGKKFSTNQNLARQIMNILDIPSEYRFSDFLAALNVMGEVYKTKIPIIIDGINESTNGIGISNIWKNELKSFIKEFENLKNLLLITTCRTTYKKYIWRDENPENSEIIRSFYGKDKIELITKYFDYYKIKGNISSASVHQFKNPLYLKIFCEATNPERKNEKSVLIGTESLQNIFDRYMEFTNNNILELLELDISSNIVESSLKKIGEYLWKNKCRSIPISETCQRIDNKLPEELGDKSKTRSLEHEKLLIFRDVLNDKEEIYFVYDLFGGYIIAKYLFDEYLNIEKIMNNDEIINLLFSDDRKELHPFFDDIRRSLAILSISTNSYLHDFSKNKNVIDVSLESMFEISPDKINQDAVNFVENYFLKSKNPNYRFLIKTALIENHPFNSLFFFNLLNKMKMVERDLTWTEFVRKNAFELQEHIEYFEEDCANSETSKEYINLFAHTLIWYLSSVNKLIRDKTTQALYYFGRRFPKDFFKLMLNSFNIDDPWISERMLSACYGIAMALQNDNSSNFSGKVLPNWSIKLYELIFEKNAKYSTTHLLKRDYAKGIIDISLIHNNDLFTENEKQRITPPYKDGGIRKWGTSKDKDEGKYRDGNSPIDEYSQTQTIPQLGPSLRKYDINDEYKDEKSKLFWRIYSLGYSLNNFGEIDKEIVNNNHYADEHTGICTSYGGKYMDIAVYERAGYRDDLKLFRDEWFEKTHSSLVNIDPSFPTEIKEYKLINDDYVFNEDNYNKSIKEIEINFKDFLIVDKINNDTGPWVLLDGYFTQIQNEKEVYIFPRGFFINQKDEKSILSYFEKQDLDERWLPEISEDYYIFGGEIPWSDMYEDNKWDEIEFEGEKKFSILSCVRNNVWEDYHDSITPSRNISLPINQICRFLNLFNMPQTFDLYDDTGKASVTIEHGENYDNHQHFTFLRQDLFEEFLSKNNYKFIWAIWGNKELIELNHPQRIIDSSKIKEILNYDYVKNNG